MQQNICSAAGVHDILFGAGRLVQLQANWLMLNGALSVHIHMSLSLKHLSLWKRFGSMRKSHGRMDSHDTGVKEQC